MSTITSHDFKFFRDIFPQIKLSDSWGLTTSKSDDVIWNIVLAYLNSFPLSDQKELDWHIKSLTGYGKVNKNIKHSIEICNPFLNRDACFSDKEIFGLVSVFKERVRNYLKNKDKLFQNEPTNFRCLEASSKLLSCKIVLFSSAVQDEITVNVFPVQTSQNIQKIYTKHIAIIDELIVTCKNSPLQEKFSFCIPKEIGTQKQRQALAEILKAERNIGNDEEMILKISNLRDIINNFLISLLKNELWQVIPSLYESHDLLSKLAEAGLETDPRAKDSFGKSALFYALKTEVSPEILFLLYHHAANAYSQTEASVRSPDPVMVDNLVQLKNHLRQLERDLEYEDISEKSRCLFRDLCRINDFQIEMFSRVNDIRLRTNHDGLTEKEYEATQRKETVLTILNTYETYFNPINEESEPAEDVDDVSHFSEYYKHRDYFDNIDLISALMLFDNLFLLKERLRLPNTAYLCAEKIFFLFICLSRYTERFKQTGRIYLGSLRIGFQERLSLQSHLIILKEILEKTEISKDNIIDKLSEETVRTLKNLPLIHGDFLFSRLKHYLNTATEIVVKDLKSFLVIERCLQFLSECSEETRLNSFQKIISLSLPNIFIKYLNLIRIHSSRGKSRGLLYRYNLEQDLELFKGIQSELNKIKKLLLPIYSAQEYGMDLFLPYIFMKFNHETVEMSGLKEHKNKWIQLFSSSNMEENQSLMHRLGYLSFLNSFFDDAGNYPREGKVNLNFKGNVFNTNMASSCKCIVQNMISTVEGKWKSLEAPVSKEDVEELDSQFWCLEQILTHITTDRSLTTLQNTLYLILKKRETLFTEMKENAMQFQTTNESIHASTDEIIVAQCGIDTVCFPTESREIRDQSQEVLNPNFKFVESDGLGRKEPSNYSFSNLAFDAKERWGAVDGLGNAEFREKESEIDENDPNCSESVSVSSSGTFYHHSSVTYAEEAPVEMMDVEKKTFIEKAATFLDDYKKLSHKLFEDFSDDPQEVFHFQNIEAYCSKLEKEYISIKEGKVSNSQNKPKCKQNLIKNKSNADAPQKGKTEFITESQDELPQLKNHKIKEIQKSTKFRLNCEYESIGSYDSLQDFNYAPGNRFEFFGSRIKILKNILLNRNLQRLWDMATTPRKKFYVKEKIVQLYLNDSKIQASVEIILFHCKTVLHVKELEQLWEITTNVMNSINFRKVLGWGHTSLESVKTLAPFDLFELIEKLLKLISDEHVIDCMAQILKQSRTNFYGFMKIMRDEEDKKFKNLREQIQECQHWKQYALLIPFIKIKKKKYERSDYFMYPFPEKLTHSLVSNNLSKNENG